MKSYGTSLLREIASYFWYQIGKIPTGYFGASLARKLNDSNIFWVGCLFPKRSQETGKRGSWVGTFPCFICVFWASISSLPIDNKVSSYYFKAESMSQSRNLYNINIIRILWVGIFPFFIISRTWDMDMLSPVDNDLSSYYFKNNL